MPEERPYHHGDLRRALLTAAVELIAERGTAAVSLRDLARRAGVSHAAPAHHFGDKAGLFTAIAVEGHRLLGETLEPAVSPADFLDMGVRYVRFATRHPAHFEVMFQPDLHRPDDPDLAGARARTRDLLRAGLPHDLPEPETELAALAGWSLAHGFATLCLTGNLRRSVGDHDPADFFRDMARKRPGV